MTAQIADKLIYQNRQQALYGEPLSAYFRQHGLSPGFKSVCTGLWRGYLCSWKIKGGKLWLIDLQGILENDEVASMETFFPGNNDSVFADWYSGVLRLPQGELLQYVHMGYESRYERDLFIEIEAGMVKGERLVENGVAEQEEIDPVLLEMGIGRFVHETLDDRFPLKAGFSRKHFPLGPSLTDSGLSKPFLEQFLSVYFDHSEVAETLDDHLGKLRSEGVEVDDRSRPVWLACATPDPDRLREMIQSEPGHLTSGLYRFIAHRALQVASKAQGNHFVSEWAKEPRIFHYWEVDAREAMCPYLEMLTCLRTALPLPADADWLMVSILADNLALFEELLALGVDPNAMDSDGRLPLVEACGRPWGQPFSERLLQTGADVNGADRLAGNTPLMATVITQTEMQQGQSGRFDCLLRHGVTIDLARSHDQSTSLMQAISLNKPAYVRWLLESGANPYLENRDCQTALDLMDENRTSRHALASVFEVVYAELWRKKHPGPGALA